jgi:hypothetical protein
MSKTKIILFTLVAILMPFYNSLAQQLEKIPGQDPEVPEGMNPLIYYLDSLYKFGISITGILAIFMIALGAFAYIVTSAGNASKMLDAKEKITNALIGLVIALTAYLFLYVINPDLVGGTLESPGDIMSRMVSDEEDEGNSGILCNGTLPGGGPGGGTSFTGGEIDCSECGGSNPVDQNGDGIADILVCREEPVDENDSENNGNGDSNDSENSEENNEPPVTPNM